MSEPRPCPDPDCEGVFTGPNTPDGLELCSVCTLTRDMVVDSLAIVRDYAPESEASIAAERTFWARAQVVELPIDNRDAGLKWYRQFEEFKKRYPVLKRNPRLRYKRVLGLLKNDPELRNRKLRYASVGLVPWLKRLVIEANERAWPAHDDYDEGESLRALVECAQHDCPLWDAFQAAIQDLEHPPPDFERFLRFPVELLRDRIHEIADDESGAFDAESKGWRAEFEALWANPDTRRYFCMGPNYLHGYNCDPLDRWARDVSAGQIQCPRGAQPRTLHRNARIVRAIERLRVLGMPATRHDKSPNKYSACDAVAAVMHLSYDRVKGIWKQHRGRTLRRSSSR